MKNVKLSVKLIGGFCVVALITLTVGFVGWRGATSIGAHLDEVGTNQLPSIQNLLGMDSAFESLRVAQRTLLNPAIDPETRERQHRNFASVRERYKQSWEAWRALPHSNEESELGRQLERTVDAWRAENDLFIQYARELEKTGILNPFVLRGDLDRFRGDHYKLMGQISHLLHTNTQFDGGEDPSLCELGKWMAGYKTDNPKINSALKEAVQTHNTFHFAAKKVKELVKTGAIENASTVYVQEMVPAAEKTFEQLNFLWEEVSAATGLYEKMNNQAMVVTYEKQIEARAILGKLVEMSKQKANSAVREADEVAGQTKWISLSGMLMGFLLALVLGIFLSLSITRPLNQVIHGLEEGADQVASASSQVASTSQGLAEGASEQASSLEETSSSLEEMSSMVRQNAGNSLEANQLMKEASGIVERANESMSCLTTSMQEISSASEETQKIVKTIDEIAFQTNLLALNAAVEAARAGEAGAGFAVVADEVRNLALRAAEAAKHTADLIEQTVKKVREGAELVGKTDSEFREVSRGVARSGALVSEISLASAEQAQGIEQVTKAVSEMDRVVQQNAANAEESASASEELNAQAQQMKIFVSELTMLVGGQESGTKGFRTSENKRLVTQMMLTSSGASVKNMVGEPSPGRPKDSSAQRKLLM